MQQHIEGQDGGGKDVDLGQVVYRAQGPRNSPLKSPFPPCPTSNAHVCAIARPLSLRGSLGAIFKLVRRLHCSEQLFGPRLSTKTSLIRYSRSPKQLLRASGPQKGSFPLRLLESYRTLSATGDIDQVHPLVTQEGDYIDVPRNDSVFVRRLPTGKETCLPVQWGRCEVPVTYTIAHMCVYGVHRRNSLAKIGTHYSTTRITVLSSFAVGCVLYVHAGHSPTSLPAAQFAHEVPNTCPLPGDL